MSIDPADMNVRLLLDGLEISSIRELREVVVAGRAALASHSALMFAYNEDTEELDERLRTHFTLAEVEALGKASQLLSDRCHLTVRAVGRRDHLRGEEK